MGGGGGNPSKTGLNRTLFSIYTPNHTPLKTLILSIFSTIWCIECMECMVIFRKVVKEYFLQIPLPEVVGGKEIFSIGF